MTFDRTFVVALLCAAVTGAACSDEPACADYPDTFEGTMTGTMDGAAFAANLTVPHSVYLDISVQESGSYHGNFYPTQGSQITRGESFHFGVDCTTGDLEGVMGFYEDTDVDGYARGSIDGRVGAEGGAGTWTCTYGCEGSGTWSVE